MLSFVAAFYLSSLLFLHLYWPGIWSASYWDEVLLHRLQGCTCTCLPGTEKYPWPSAVYLQNEGFSPLSSTRESVSSRLGLSPAQTSLFPVLALCFLCSGRGSSGFSVPEVITKILSLLCPCTWMVAPLIILNTGSGSTVQKQVGQCSSGTEAGDSHVTLCSI